MKKIQWIAALTATVLLLSLLSGCSRTGQTSESSPSSGLGVVDPDLENSAGTELPDNSGAESSSNEPSSQVDPSSGSESEENSALAGQIAEMKFKEVFDKNPIDQAYNTEANAAVTNVEMISVVTKFCDIWEAEVSIADKKAKKALKGDALAAYTQSQQQWENTKDSEIDAIREEAQNNVGGSGLALEVSSLTSDFYRARVYSIYRAVYEANGTLPQLTYNTANG